MAEEPDSGSKTEEASPRKLEEARRRGEVPKSSDLTQWASLAGAVGVVAMAGGGMSTTLAQQLVPFIDHPQAFDLAGGGGAAVM